MTQGKKQLLRGTLDPEAALALAGDAAPRADGPTRVVVVGGGFAGVYTAKYLTALLGSRKDVVVELLSAENYFVFQPLLPEVAAGGIAATHVVNPVREIVPLASFRCCTVRSVDLAKKRVLVSQGEGLELVGVPYDHLVFCLGKVTSFATMPGVAEHALAMKDLADAFRLRNHVIQCLELADIEPDPERKRARLTFVVAGGGFSGVETMGELAELVERSLRYFPRITPAEVTFELIHSGQTLLPEMPEVLGAAARRILEGRGITMRLGVRVRSASPERVYLSDGTAIATRTFVCTVGNAPNPIVTHALETGGFKEAKIQGRGIGVFETDATLECLDRPGYWAVGDCAGVPRSGSKGGFSPPTAQFAIREAKACARNIVATIDGTPRVAFAFDALGVLASLGRRRAVAQVFGVTLTGFVAWFLWRTIYLMKLPGFARRLRVALDWTLDLVFSRDITELKVLEKRALRIHHHEPGELIVRAGQVGREFYVVLRGEVEVIGGGDVVVAKLGPREVFGEKALLEDTHRTASVRAAGPVDVLVMSRGDFRAMVQGFPVLDDYFKGLLAARQPDATPKVEAPSPSASA